MTQPKPQLDITEWAAEARRKHLASPRRSKGSFLILGEKGVGKTSLIATCPTPILVYSFDPDGTIVLDPLIDAGKVYVRKYEQDKPSEPHAYLDWEIDHNAAGVTGVYKHFATVAIDSLTTFSQSMLWQVVPPKQRPSESLRTPMTNSQGMQIRDWGRYLNNFVSIIRSLATMPCHVVLTGHVGRVQDAVTQGFVRQFMLPGQSKDQVPILLPEVYILRALGPDNIRTLLTGNSDGYKAATRMGGRQLPPDQQFALKEEPDIRALLRKAGYDHEDKEDL